MNIGAFTLAPNMLVVNGIDPIADWEKSTKVVLMLQRSVNWWIGDIIVYGEQRFGDDIYQVFDPDYVSESLLERCVWMSRQYKPQDRNPSLSWTHHKEVASFPHAVRMAILAKAAMNNWGTTEIREYAKRLRMAT